MRLHVYFDYGSPYAYLAWQRIRSRPEAYADVDVLWKPVSLYHIVAKEGGKLNKDLPNLARYNFQDLRRWAKAYGVPFWFPKSFPANTLHASRGHFLADMEGPETEAAWMERVFLAHWQHDQDIGDVDLLASIAADLDIPDFSSRIGQEGIKRLLTANTQEAYEAGAPGVPYLVVEDGDAKEGFWGNDRLDWVEARIAGRTTPSMDCTGSRGNSRTTHMEAPR